MSEKESESVTVAQFLDSADLIDYVQVEKKVFSLLLKARGEVVLPLRLENIVIRSSALQTNTGMWTILFCSRPLWMKLHWTIRTKRFVTRTWSLKVEPWWPFDFLNILRGCWIDLNISTMINWLLQCIWPWFHLFDECNQRCLDRSFAVLDCIWSRILNNNAYDIVESFHYIVWAILIKWIKSQISCILTVLDQLTSWRRNKT